MKAKNLTLLFVALVPMTSWAGRIAKSFPIETPTGLSNSTTGAACWAGQQRSVSFINLSDIPQTITLRFRNIKLRYTSCDGANPSPPFGPTWRQDSVASACWTSEDQDLPDYTMKFTLAASSSETKVFNAWCRLLRQGVTDCAINNNPTQRTTDLNKVRISIARSALEIEINEDRGAVIANILAQTNSHCSEFDDTTRFNIPVNGGRPF